MRRSEAEKRQDKESNPLKRSSHSDISWEAQQLANAAPKLPEAPNLDEYELGSSEAEFDEGDIEDDLSEEDEGEPNSFDSSLPVVSHKKELIDLIHSNQVTIVAGETGSGKTTQLPQFLVNDGLAGSDRKQVVVTQPRRLAAMAVATRVADEMGSAVGKQVGYTIRFEDRSSSKTAIRFVTDGMLVREFLSDPHLSKVSVVMIDEAHERTLHTDIVLALVRDLARQRPELRVVISSATLNVNKFSQYFGGAPVYTVPGRRFPVDIYYAKQPEPNYLQAALMTILQIHSSQPVPGDILVFLPGQEEIESLQENLLEAKLELGTNVRELLVLPVYAALPSEKQARIFEKTPSNSRKVVLATNIAETSLTIDGISYVVDPGLVKEQVYSARTGMDTLIVRECSQASARQRAGRAGRTGPGKCFRLYTKQAFQQNLPPEPVPEVLRVNLAAVTLLLLSLGVGNVLEFGFLDKPPTEAMVKALELLYSLQAVNQKCILTSIGRRMAELPTDPMTARSLLAAEELGVGPAVATVVALLGELGQIFYRPKHRKSEAERAHNSFADNRGDHFTLLNIWSQYHKAGGQSVQWCRDNFVQHRSLKRANDVRQQLLMLCRRIARNSTDSRPSLLKPDHAVEKALVAGFFGNTARLSKTGQNYVTLRRGQAVVIHPSSSLHSVDPSPSLLLYTELVLTSREFMRGCLVIEPTWVAEMAPHFYSTRLESKIHT